jgi:hypothetical protein
MLAPVGYLRTQEEAPMDDFDDDRAGGEIEAVSARVLFDGNLMVMLRVPGSDELAEVAVPGDRHTLFMSFAESTPIDLGGTRGDDRYCQELVARHVARMNADLAQRRRMLGRRWREHVEREEGERYV